MSETVIYKLRREAMQCRSVARQISLRQDRERLIEMARKLERQAEHYSKSLPNHIEPAGALMLRRW